MKPIPAEKDSETSQTDESSTPATDSKFAFLSGGAGQNRRISKGWLTDQAYPWLLLASTAAATIFFIMYLTKPFIVTDEPNRDNHTLEADNGKLPQSKLLPNANQLPGDKDANESIASEPDHTHLKPPVIGKFEETNLRVQHILSAEAPGGYTGRIDVEVPVLYQSRQLRWTTQEVEQARLLLSQLVEHQNKTRQLRAEGANLLKSWDELIEKSIPSSQLRADSPSLPENQHSAVTSTDNNSKLNAESIKLNPSEQ